MLGQISAHVFMGLLETAISKVNICVRCCYSIRLKVFHLGLALLFIDEMLPHIVKNLFLEKSFARRI